MPSAIFQYMFNFGIGARPKEDRPQSPPMDPAENPQVKEEVAAGNNNASALVAPGEDAAARPQNFLGSVQSRPVVSESTIFGLIVPPQPPRPWNLFGIRRERERPIGPESSSYGFPQPKIKVNATNSLARMERIQSLNQLHGRNHNAMLQSGMMSTSKSHDSLSGTNKRSPSGDGDSDSGNPPKKIKTSDPVVASWFGGSGEDDGGKETKTGDTAGLSGFVCTNTDLRITPPLEELNKAVRESNNYVVLNLTVEHPEHGEAQFMGYRDFIQLGPLVDIGKYITFFHGSISFKADFPTELKYPARFTLYNITRNDFATQIGAQDISDEELGRIVAELSARMNGVGHYNEEEQRWIIVIQGGN